MIKSFADYPIIDGQNKYVSAILGYNGLSAIGDLENKYASFDTYFSTMCHLKNEDTFIEYLKNNKNKKYCVIGDYDCDGIMATAIITYALTLCGYSVTFNIPNRFDDGYGMHKRQIDIAVANGAEVIITVDNGICTNDVIDYAHQKGLYVIITDHHLPQGINNGDIVINPHYNNDSYTGISGAEVAMKLVYQMYLNLVGIDRYMMYNFATMAFFTVYSDVMPMLNENRDLTRAAFRFIDEQINNENSFIFRLAHMLYFYDPKCKSDPSLRLPSLLRHFNKENIEFYVIPIINACNRVIGDVNDLVYDIMSLFASPYIGDEKLYYNINLKRKYMQSELDSVYNKNKNNNYAAVVDVLKPEDWDTNYSGIVGLVASSVVEKENKPALIGIDVENDDDIVRFSGRSIPGFNLYEALEEIKKENPTLSLQFGGHSDALGASCKKRDIDIIRKKLSEKVQNIELATIDQTYISINNEKVDNVINAYFTLWPYGNSFQFPKLHLKSKIKYLSKQDYTFTVQNMPIPIKFFTKDEKEKVADYAFNHRDIEMEMFLSMIEDKNGVMLKLEKLL